MAFVAKDQRTVFPRDGNPARLPEQGSASDTPPLPDALYGKCDMIGRFDFRKCRKIADYFAPDRCDVPTYACVDMGKTGVYS